MSTELKLDDFDGLKRAVKQFLNEDEITTPRPILRIGELITTIRQFKTAIVVANIPIDLPGEAKQQQQMLRKHRLSMFDELRTQMESLLKVNTDWIINGEPWRTQDCHWQIKVWIPLHRWIVRGFDLLFEGMDSSEWPFAHGLAVLKEWEDDEQAIEFEAFLRITDFLPDSEWPIVDFDRGTLSWAGREGGFTDRDLAVLNLIIVARGDVVRKVAIIKETGDTTLGDEAFRKMFSRLKKRLADAGFSDIADSIIQLPKGMARLDHNRLLNSLISDPLKDVT